MKEHILVTGGAGFIGSHLTEFLLEKDHEVKVLDNFSRGTQENIQSFKDHPNFTLIAGDIRDRALLEKTTDGIDVIFHLAASIHVDESRENTKTVGYFENNVIGTINVLDMALKNNVKKVIYASSSEAYGNARYSPMDEEHPLCPASPYAATKAAADRACYSYFNTFGQNVVIVRNFNIFGPRQRSDDYGAVTAIFTERVLNGLPPKIFGDGMQTRDYMYVADAVQAYNLVLQKNGIGGEAINFGTVREITMNSLAQKVIKACGRTDLKPKHVDSRPGEVKRLCADIKKAQRLLGFKPNYTFDEGLRLFIEWFKHKSDKR